MEVSESLAFAIGTAHAAGKITLRHFQTGVLPEWKEDAFSTNGHLCSAILSKLQG